MTSFGGLKPRLTLHLFLCGCVLLGIGYHFASIADLRWALAPFVACSLLHFWFDGFVWSVGKKQV